jgi:hypothetical protein
MPEPTPLLTRTDIFDSTTRQRQDFDLYYFYNAYPEVRRELGKTNYWMLVVSKMF